jgi:hypothetical protein
MGRTRVDRLVDHVSDGAADALATDLRAWIERSRPFRAFAELHRDKIRKKVRSARGREPRLDLRAELAVAGAVLADRRIELAYEAYGSTAGGPDFTLSFRSHPAFNLEVTRWRGDRGALERQLGTKLRQLRPGIANVVLVAVDTGSGPLPDPAGLSDAVRTSTERSDQRDARLHLRRLSGIVVWAEGRSGPEWAALWTNPSARIPLPQAAARAVLSALRAEAPPAMDPPPRSG